MGFIRSVTGLCALAVAVFYLLKAGELTDQFKWICTAAVITFSFAWIIMGSPKAALRSLQPNIAITQSD